MTMWLDELNFQQRAVVEAADGPMMIVAGPGTGKTKTLAARIAWLLHQEVLADDILALTFTRKAAAEMRTRIKELVAFEDNNTANPFFHDGCRRSRMEPEVTTFHALGLRLTGSDTRAFVGNDERLEVIRGLRRPTELKAMSTRQLGLSLSVYKNGLYLPDGAMGELVQRYNEALAERGRRDFDDLLREAYELMRIQPEVGRRRYVLVDEFQDTNELQYELMKLLIGEGGLFVIGDPRQSIYGFRGASGGVFERFTADFPDVKRVDLTLNYRSAKAIVAVGNAVFVSEPGLEAVSPGQGRVRVLETLHEYSEAAWITHEIEAGIGGIDMLQGQTDEPEATSFRDYAILYRTHRSAMALQRRLLESGLPYQVVGEGSPYEQPIIQMIVIILRQLGGEELPGNLEVQHVTDQLKNLVGQVSVAELVREITVRLGKLNEEKIKGELAQLTSAAVQFGMDMAAAGRYFRQLSESEYYDPSAEAITLTTIHAAKGLEFEHVFVLGLEEGLLPHKRHDMADDVDEERRLFYVAVTRARRQLDLIHARERGGERSEPSRFLVGLPVERTVDPTLVDSVRKRERRRMERAQGALF
jgi:DNA helicase-2/ATP-dependent DNA helicase PcrA